MRQLAVLLLVMLVSACGTDTTESVADIGWMFNYKDYTDVTRPDEMRGCDNQPASPIGPAYDAITKVRVLIEDPEAQVPGIDKDYDCDQGVGNLRVPIRGLVKQAYRLLLEAKTATGTVLYRYEQAEYDLTSKQADTYALPTTTGELHFYPRYQASLSCPATVARLRYSMFKKTAGVPESTPTTTGVLDPACVQGFTGLESQELFIRGVPIVIDPSSYDTYNDFKMRLEALDTGDNVVYCATNQARTIRPGNNSVGGDENLLPGSSCL